ncbi:hypothetical protein H8E88_02650 [candidate division KSB1 bacterium]|nr:hypothetical protein [candidate division KSB1 bacterium]
MTYSEIRLIIGFFCNLVVSKESLGEKIPIATLPNKFNGLAKKIIARNGSPFGKMIACPIDVRCENIRHPVKDPAPDRLVDGAGGDDFWFLNPTTQLLTLDTS